MHIILVNYNFSSWFDKIQLNNMIIYCGVSLVLWVNINTECVQHKDYKIIIIIDLLSTYIIVVQLLIIDTAWRFVIHISCCHLLVPFLHTYSSFSPVDTKLATCSEDGTIRTFDFIRGAEEFILRGVWVCVMQPLHTGNNGALYIQRYQELIW